MTTSLPVTIDLTLHGGIGDKLILAEEKQSDFDALLMQLLSDHRPGTTQSRLSIENLALAHWFLWRRQRAHGSIESAIYEQEPNEANWTIEQTKKLAFAERHRTQAERAVKRAQNIVDAWQKDQRRAEDREQREVHWQAAHQLRERRVALQEQKFELIKNREAARQAIRFAKNAVSSPSKRKSQSAPSSPVAASEPELRVTLAPHVQNSDPCALSQARL